MIVLFIDQKVLTPPHILVDVLLKIDFIVKYKYFLTFSKK